MSGNRRVAVIPVRQGTLPAGGADTAAEAGDLAVVIGDRAGEAAATLAGLLGSHVAEIVAIEAGELAPARWAGGLAGCHGEHGDDLLSASVLVVLPASPDGRDLAPRLAAALRRPLLSGAIRVSEERVTLARWGGRVAEEHRPGVPFVATFEPGCRSLPVLGPDDVPAPVTHRTLAAAPPTAIGSDARTLQVSPPDPSSMDLAEAPRIMAGGAGLGSAAAFALLMDVATALGASMGATRVVTDAGWVGHQRQIGTTGVAVDPRVYVALGISGAVQHTGGLGDPDHVVSVNLDASCPMMAMAELAIVCDAPLVLKALADRLGVPHGG